MKKNNLCFMLRMNLMTFLARVTQLGSIKGGRKMKDPINKYVPMLVIMYLFTAVVCIPFVSRAGQTPGIQQAPQLVEVEACTLKLDQEFMLTDNSTYTYICSGANDECVSAYCSADDTTVVFMNYDCPVYIWEKGE